MQGRYGVDDLSRFTMGVALVLIILAMFANIFSRTVGSTLDILGVAAIVYAYIRIFSRNIQQRYAENQKFLQMTSKSRTRTISPFTKLPMMLAISLSYTQRPPDFRNLPSPFFNVTTARLINSTFSLSRFPVTVCAV